MKLAQAGLLIVAMMMLGCAHAPISDGAVVWNLDNLKSIGGHNVEVIGSPRVVTSAGGSAIRFNGESDGLVLPMNPVQGWSEFTIEVLMQPDAGGPTEQRFLHFQDESNARGLLELRMYEKGWALDAFLFSGASQKALFDQNKLHPADRWTWVAMTYQNGTITSFVNGGQELQGEVIFPASGPGKTSIGVRQNRISWFKGEIREVRFYPKALAAPKLHHAG